MILTSFINQLLQADTPSSFIDKFKNMKKPNDFFDFSRMSKPNGFIDAQQRISYNLSYFASNYFAIVILFFLYSIFTNIPFFIFLFAELTLIYFVQKHYGQAEEFDLKVFTLHRNIWYTILLVVNVPVFFIWSPLSSVFWLSIFSAAIIVSHAAIMDKPVETAYSDVV